MSGCRSEAGRLFQILRPATEELLSPSRVFVLGTVKTLAWVEQNWGHPDSAISWQSLTRYDVCVTMQGSLYRAALALAVYWRRQIRRRQTLFICSTTNRRWYG